MKCPKCNKELRRSKKDPNYGLCDNCRLKFQWVEEYYDDEDDYEDDDNYYDEPEIKHKSKRKQEKTVVIKKKTGLLTKIFAVIGILVIITAVASAIGISEKPKKVGNRTSSDSANTSTTSSEEEKDIFYVGEIAEYKNVQAQVIGYEESNGTEFFKPADGNIFVLINMEIANNSDNEINVSSVMNFNFYCDGYATNYSANAFIAMQDKTQLDGTIAAGMKMNGYIAMEVPVSWKSIQVHYNSELFTSNPFKFEINKQ